MPPRACCAPAPLRSCTSVDRVDMMAELGPGDSEAAAAWRGEGSESSRGGRTFLEGSTGVWLEPALVGRSSASTSSVMEDS